MRRIASKVHQQVGRLLDSGFIKTPAWYQAVLDHPPLPLPPRSRPLRSLFDLPTASKKLPTSSISLPCRKRPSNLKHLRPPRMLPESVEYLEDRVRRQFFRDRPFEAFRARTLVEDGTIEEENTVSGEAWTRLRQKGRAPLPEDAIRFAVHLYTIHKKSLTLAYMEAVRQYDALRSEQHIMTRFALLEARAHGAQFRVGPDKIDTDSPETIRGYEMEQRALGSYSENDGLGNLSIADMHVARKRWRAVVEPPLIEKDGWSGGRDYVRRWQQGIWPDYEARLPNDSPVQLEEKPAKLTDWAKESLSSSAKMYQ